MGIWLLPDLWITAGLIEENGNERKGQAIY